MRVVGFIIPRSSLLPEVAFVEDIMSNARKDNALLRFADNAFLRHGLLLFLVFILACGHRMTSI
jgi:hypothetical protein